MKKIILMGTFMIVLSATKLFAQNYNTAIGVGVDFGKGTTVVGPSLKHFFGKYDAVQADVLFGNSFTFIGAYYEYHESFMYNPQWQWYLGLGPQVALGNNQTSLFVRPTVGLEYKIEGAPISFAADWRPQVRLNNGSGFQGLRFGGGLRFAF